MPYPALTFSYLRNALLIWALLRVALMLAGITNPSGMLLLVGIPTLIVWFEHRRSGENFFHSNLGARVWIAVAASAFLVSVLEFLF